MPLVRDRCVVIANDLLKEIGNVFKEGFGISWIHEGIAGFQIYLLHDVFFRQKINIMLFYKIFNFGCVNLRISCPLADLSLLFDWLTLNRSVTTMPTERYCLGILPTVSFSCFTGNFTGSLKLRRACIASAFIKLTVSSTKRLTFRSLISPLEIVASWMDFHSNILLFIV